MSIFSKSQAGWIRRPCHRRMVGERQPDLPPSAILDQNSLADVIPLASFDIFLSHNSVNQAGIRRRIYHELESDCRSNWPNGIGSCCSRFFCKIYDWLLFSRELAKYKSDIKAAHDSTLNPL